jgi:hypothetical protein
MRSALSAIVPGLVLAAASPAGGRVLHTPPLPRETVGVLVCRAANESPEAQTLRVQAFDTAGSEMLDTGGFSLAPGAVFLSGAGSLARTCRFSVTGDGAGLRATGHVVRGSAWQSLTALPRASVEGQASRD